MVQVVTGDSQEKVMIFRDKQTLHHNIYISIVVLVGWEVYFTKPFQGVDTTGEHITDCDYHWKCQEKGVFPSHHSLVALTLKF